MSQQYDLLPENRKRYQYKCEVCDVTSSEDEWNKATFQRCSDGTYESWEDDDSFYSLAVEYFEHFGAWFICPNCKEHHDNTYDISRIFIDWKSNKDAKVLLEERY